MNTFISPFKVQLCWFRSATDPRCTQIARQLYEYFHRPLEDDFVLRPGVEIPVEVGRELGDLLAALSENREPAVGTRLVIALLDKKSFDDPNAHKVVAAAAARWTDARRDEVFLPLLLDKRWANKLYKSAVEALAGLNVPKQFDKWWLAAEVGVVAGRALLRRLDDKQDPPRPHVFISHAKVDGRGIAKQLATHMHDDSHVEPWFDENDVERGEELCRQLEAATRDAVVLVVRTDRYSESPWCALELLAGKRARVPIVTLLAGKQGEPSTSAYGGNHRTMVWSRGREAEIVARCVQSWLHGHYFLQYAQAALALAGLPADTQILSRRPELLDIADGGATRRLIVYPDPPLTEGETTILRTARPSVRLATPTTLFGRVLLANDPEPPLSGMTLAFSLSNAEGLPELDRAIKRGSGLTQQHLNDVLFAIVTTTVQSGTRIAYGGDFRRAGFSQLLSDLLRSRRRLGTLPSAQLQCYIRPYKQTPKATEAVEEIVYEPVAVPMPAGTPPRLTKDLRSEVWHLAMREQMAIDSHARILLGGKTTPASSSLPDGYHGPWPGLLEEAWRTLRRGRGVFVVGGFGGAAGLIADMLRTNQIPPKLQRATVQPSKAFDKARIALQAENPPELVLAKPDGLADIEDLARWVLDDWQRFCATSATKQSVPQWSNGLTRAENEQLFVSTDRTEIMHLVFEGLRRCSRIADAGLKLMAYHGDIGLVPDVDGYAVTVTPGVPPEGASVALDKRMGGRLSAITQQPLAPITPVQSGGDLVGSQVLVVRLDLAAVGQAITAERVAELAELVANDADRLGIRSIACAAFASTMGLTLEQSARAMVTGFSRARRGALRTIVFCETNGLRYEGLRDALGEGVVELRSGPSAQPMEKSAMLTVEASEVADGWHVRSTLLLTGVPDAVVPRAEATITKKAWRELRRRARDYQLSLDQGNRLWRELLSDEIREQIAKYQDRRLVVITEENGSGLPWEFLTDDKQTRIACTRGVVRRIALRGAAVSPASEPRAGRRVLLVVNPLGDLPNTQVEADNIVAVLRDRPDIEVTRLDGAAATHSAVVAALATGQYDILHYAGHAYFDANDRARSGLILHDQEVLTAADLPNVRPPRFVYLSGCESVRLRNEVSDVPVEEPPNSQSLAEALLRKGVSALVGTFFVVADGIAQVFASQTYQQITAGQPLGAAVLTARGLVNTSDWGNFLLYGDDQLII